MSKQGISTGSAPNDGTGDTLLAGTIKINNNFNEIYDIFGDGSNLVSFVSFATLLDILPTVVLHPHQFLLVLQRVLQITLISIHLVLLQQVMQMLVRLLFNSLVRLQMVLLRLELQQQCSESKQTVWSALEHHYLLHN